MAEPSGVEWCSRFPGSASTGDLLPEFRGRVLAFVSAMERGGAHVIVTATWRPPRRAYLMHWCWMIANAGQDPESVPPMADVDIDWGHGGDHGSAKAAARAMAKTYDLEYPPALTSRHTQRRAIDMTIGWNNTLSIRDFDGHLRNITSEPRNGSNPVVIQVGASFGVVKLVSDPPHWSDDGH